MWASCWWAGGTFLSAGFPRKSVSGLSRMSMGVEMPEERVEMRLSSMAARERKVCFDVVELIDGCCIDYLDTIEIGYQNLS